MRQVTLHNCSDGCDKIYVLEITQELIGNAFSHVVTARWGARNTAMVSDYVINGEGQSKVKLRNVSLSSAIAYVSRKVSDKEARGYRVVSRRDSAFPVAQAPVVAAAAAAAPVAPPSEAQRWRQAAMIQPPAFPTVRNGRAISAEYPASVAFPVTTAYVAAVQAAIRTGDLSAVRAVRDGGALSEFIQWQRSVIAVWEGRPAQAPVAPAAPVQSRRSLGAQRAAATRRRRREAGVYANRPPRQSPRPAARPATVSDDCGGNPVAVGAICAADYWKR